MIVLEIICAIAEWIYTVLSFAYAWITGKKYWYGVLCALLLSGCGYSFFAAKTVATYETPDGKKISYESDKEQIGLDATYELYESGAVKSVKIKVDKAGGQEAAVEAMMQSQIMWASLFQKLLPLLEKAGMAGS